jgi:hypothetical protein
MASSRVALVHSTPATIRDDYQRLLALALGLEPKPIGTTLVCPIVSQRVAMPGVGAMPWQLDGVLAALAPRQPLVVPPVRDLRGFAGVLHAHTLVVQERPVISQVLAIALIGCSSIVGRQPAETQQAEVLLSRFAPDAPRRMFIADATTTARIFAMRSPLLAQRDTLIAGEDPRAIDAVTAALLGLPARADAPPLELIGDTDLLPPLTHLRERSAHGVRQEDTEQGRRKNQFFEAGAAFAAGFRWRLFEQRLFEEWLEQTGWGKLFRAYQRQALLLDDLSNQ